MKAKKIWIIIVSVLLAWTLSASAGLFIWVDEKGVKHYSDAPPINSQETAKGASKEMMSSSYYETMVFHIKDAPNPSFLGRYLPIHPTQQGFPQYEKEINEHNKDDPRATMEVTGVRGNWMWRIEGDRTKYFSAHVPEGTRPDNVRIWKITSPSGSGIKLEISSENIVTISKFREHSYAYYLSEDSVQYKDWMKNEYKVIGHPDIQVNGIYRAVNWSSPLPRYMSNSKNCLKADALMNKWEWHIGKCEDYAFSADPEPEGTMPENVRRWYERKGMLYTSFKIKKVTQ